MLGFVPYVKTMIARFHVLFNFLFTTTYISCGRSPAEIVGSNSIGGMEICCKCCMLSGIGLGDGLITRPEESYRLWCVVVCDLKT
jgi:hypothetical protein